MITTQTRKQRELQEREQSILSVARPILLSEGINSLSMDRIAAQLAYSKGTIYNHFPNKEDIVAALACEAMDLRVGLFERASASRMISRERLVAIGTACELYFRDYREHFGFEQMVRQNAIWEKTSEKRKNLLRQCELKCMSIVSGIVRDAVACLDLKLPDGMSAEEFVFGFWSLTFGSQILIATSSSLSDIGIEEPFKSIRYHCWTLMNGYGWMPELSFDETVGIMEESLKRIRVNAAQ